VSHGFSGVLKITAQQFQPLVREWLDAGNHTGSKLGDVNEPGEQGTFKHMKNFQSTLLIFRY